MARNGSGTYVKVGADAQFDTVISETYYNDQINDLVTALTQSVSKDGQTTLTGNINAGSQKLTALAVGTALTDSLTLGQAQNASMNYVASDTGGANAAVIAPAPAVTSYVAGQVFHFKAAANSTGATTLNVSGLGTKAVQIGGAAISGASILTTGVTSVIYDGTQFQLLSADRLDGSGDLVGPGSSTNNSLAKFDGTTGKLLKDGAVIGTDVQAYNADTLFADVADNLTAGYSTTVYNAGTKSSGTYTPDQDNGNIQRAVNGGAHTLAPTTDDCAVIIQYTNNASAGTITTSGFTLVDGDDISTTNGDDFFFYLTKANGFSLLTVKALQ
tara:strand:- start:149 stop:1135 length:987 start_codon:yes stop_codon:yes gene_type:complete